VGGDARFAWPAAHSAAGRFEPLHDVRLVLAPAFQGGPLAGAIVASWLIAFVEYCLAVPANRWGSAVYTAAQLKTIREVITLSSSPASRYFISRSR
jgi:hypothetical protein